jgi:hypothetical protein
MKIDFKRWMLVSSALVIGTSAVFASAFADDQIPKNAMICAVSNHYNDGSGGLGTTFIYSCDGGAPAELDPVVTNLPSPDGLNSDMTMLSGQLAKFLKLGYVLKNAENGVYLFVKG